jgi:hypothetical protein
MNFNVVNMYDEIYFSKYLRAITDDIAVFGRLDPVFVVLNIPHKFKQLYQPKK